jgi:periplasmic protein TonB
MGIFELKTPIPKTNNPALRVPALPTPREQTQRRMMTAALILLLVALAVVLYRDRDFWFPDTQDADDQLDSVPAMVTISTPDSTAIPSATPEKSSRKKQLSSKHHAALSSPIVPTADAETVPPISATTTRTVLPPLEVEVVAGDYHRTIHPGTNSINVDLQPGSASQFSAPPTTTASLISNAAGQVQMSAGAAEVVSQPVRPGYPVLARQMKVQGSVILQALIGRDGTIQDLHVLSGPPILAAAAREAVRQWRFKPHYMNDEPVETQANITVNFTISTN